MKRKIIFLISIAVVLVSSGCNRKSAETSSVIIRMPSLSEIKSLHWVNSELLNFKNSKRLDSLITLMDSDSETMYPKWGLAAPVSILDINCFAVFAGGPEQDLRKNTCYHGLTATSESEYKQFFSYGQRKGLVGLGQSTEISVVSGPGRSFYLAGIKTVDGTCQDFSEISGQNKVSKFSIPVLMGSEIVDLEPGDKTLEIGLKSAFSAEDHIAYCDEDLNSSSPGGPPQTETPPGTVIPPSTNAFSVSAVQTQDLSTSLAGASYSLVITVTNNSTSGFESGIVLPAPVAPFSFVSSGCAVILNVGESCVLTYSFSPISAIAYSQILPASVTYQGVTQNFNVTLAGNGVVNPTLVVSELYSAYESWNEYVTSASSYNSPTQCAGTESTIGACIHAGEKKKATLGSAYSTCANLTASDSLAVFKWKCAINDAGHAEMRSIGFQAGKGLKDLINFSSGNWNSIFLAVQYSGITIYQSTLSTTWWLNPLSDLSLTSAGSALTTTSTIYYLNSSLNRTAGWVVNADQIAIVFNSGVKLTITGTPTSLCSITGESSGATLYGGICMGDQKFIWIEANIDMNGQSGNGVYLVDSEFNSIYLTKVSGQSGSHAGIKLYNSSCNKIIESEIVSSQYGLILTGGTADNNLIQQVGIDKTFTSGSAGAGIRLDTGAEFNIFSGLNITRAYGTSGAVYLTDASYNRFFDFTISNSSDGIFIQQGHGNVFTSGTISHIANTGYAEGISISGGSTYENYFSFLTIVGTKSNAVSVANSADNSIFHQILAFNSDKGIELQANMDIFLSQIVSVNSATYPIAFSSGVSPVFNGIVKYRKTGTSLANVCDNNSSTVSCNYWGGAGSVAPAANPFVGLVNDNSQGSIGLASISSSSVASWLKFDNLFRFWGRAMSITNLIQATYSTQLTVENVQIFDLSLLASDTQYLNRSENGISPNGAMSGICSSAVDASVLANVRPSVGFNNPFLLNAKENMYVTGSGDKDGLCESGESCIYAPNFGAYQGHGNLVGPCTFTSGNGVSGVGMFYYDSNGY